MSGAVALGTPATAHAAVADAGSVEVSGLPLALQLSCTVICNFPVSATSSGVISGVDGTTPFTVSWTDPPIGSTNLSGTIAYSSGCLNVAWTGAALSSSSVTISGATLTYGTGVYSASVMLHFGGTIDPGLFVPMTNQVVITGGPSTIDIAYLGVPGVLPTVPTSPPVSCPGGTETFTASGVFLTGA
jgi:hypothetical protein